MKMVKYVALISDQVSGGEGLEGAWRKGDEAGIASYEFELPEDSDEITATMYARGLFFTHDWCMDGTSSMVIRLD